MVKNPLANARERRIDPWVGKISWNRKRQPTPVFLPGKSHGQRSLAGYSPWGHKESDMTEQLNNKRREGEVGGKSTECEVMDTKRGKYSRVSGHLMRLSSWVK